MKALEWLKREYAAGRRLKPIMCDVCGQDEGIIEHHSEDYSEPFGDHIGAYALCYRCHMMVHCRYRAKRAWEAYKEFISFGLVMQPIYSRNFVAFTDEMLSGKAFYAAKSTTNHNPHLLTEIELNAS